MSSPVRPASSSEKFAAAFRSAPDLRFHLESPRMIALSFEFAAKPDQAAGAPMFLPQALHSGLQDVTGFAGTLVMASDQEARLITVVTFWRGSEGRTGCTRSVRRVRALLAPYLDRCLRIQTMFGHAPAAHTLQPEANSVEAELIVQDDIAQEVNVYAA